MGPARFKQEREVPAEHELLWFTKVLSGIRNQESVHPERLRALDTMLKFPSTFKKPTLEFLKASSGAGAAVI